MINIKNLIEKATLYVVATPIGNLGDISIRGIDTLKNVDFIAAEDTRVSRKLLSYFNISTPMISYFKYSEDSKLETILNRILGGQSCALISDAGTPAISDPGQELVRACLDINIPVKVVPGPSAVVSALAISGQDSRRFTFIGFLPKKSSQKLEELKNLKDINHTLIFYEAPHELKNTLDGMEEIFGDRNISLVREMTKIYEEVVKTTLKEAVEFYKTTNPLGEFVLVVEGQTKIKEVLTLEEAVKIVKIKMDLDGLSLSVASKEVAKETNFSKSEIYKAMLN